MTARPPSLGHFRIFDACRRGLFLVTGHAPYLARMGAVPFLVALVNIVLVAVYNNTTPLNPFSGYLLLLPSEIMMAWTLFIGLRLWLLGERTDALPDDAAYRAERRDMMQATIAIYLLFNMMLSLSEFAFIRILGPNLDARDAGTQAAAMVVLGVLFWAVRFNVLPALTAVGYPIKRYALQASGVLLSFRIMAVMIICVEFPRLLVWSAVEPLAGKSGVLALAVAQAAGFVLKIWLFASFTVALRQMMGGEKQA